MAKNNKSFDYSTVCDQLLKEWMDQYQQDKVSALMAKSNSLTYTINTTNEEYTKLSLAKSRLNELYEPLKGVVPYILNAIEKRKAFIDEYGDLGVPLSIPPETIEHTVCQFEFALTDYANKVNDRYFANLDEVRKTLAYVTALRDFYQNLALAITIIRDSYFKTDKERRKPIVRELYRIFKALADNHLIFGIAPSIANPLIKQPIAAEEFESLEKARREADKTAKVIKDAR